jgi:hypothetical protein
MGSFPLASIAKEHKQAGFEIIAEPTFAYVFDE